MNDPDRTARIFNQALEVAPERRADFLGKICGGDDELREEVESLLRHHQPGTVSGLLEKTGATASRTSGWATSSLSVVAVAATRLFQGRRRQAIAWILAAVFLAAIGYWTRDRVERSLRAQIREQLRVVLVADVTALDTWIAGQMREASLWAGNPTVRNVAEKLTVLAGEDPAKAAKLKNSALQKEFASALRPFLSGFAAPQNGGAVLLDRTGLRIAATTPFEDSIGLQNNERAAAVAVDVLQGQVKFLPPSRMDNWARGRPADARPIIITAAPVRDSNGKIVALLAIARVVDASYTEILTVARMGATGETYAISPDGLMLSPSRFDGMLKKAGLLADRPDASSMLTVQVRDPGGDVIHGVRPPVDLEANPLTMIARVAAASRDKPEDQQSGVILEPYRDYRGIQVVGAWRWLPEHDFAVVTEVDADEAFAVVGYVERAFAVLFTLLTAFVALTLVASVTLARVRARETRLGAYTLLNMIGEGGMGKVYMARHALLRRPTAVKVLKASEALSREAILRFEREVQAASGLTHPNTIQIYDFGRTPEGTFYYAMEFLPGLTLAELVLIEGPIGPGRVVHILKQICGSLREAHEQSLLHRDIKPLNVMLCERGGLFDFAKLLDFGLVRQLGGSNTMEISTPGSLIGTPLYMAPERFRDPMSTDPRSDIYSVGAVAYFLLTGRPVFQALTSIDLQNQVLNAEPELPSKRVPHPISTDLERLVLRCLSKDPELRPSSAAALLEALDALPGISAWTQIDAREWWSTHLPGLTNPHINEPVRRASTG